MTDDAIRQMIDRRTADAGIPEIAGSRNLAPHKLSPVRQVVQ
jgi:hypothetical protein